MDFIRKAEEFLEEIIEEICEHDCQKDHVHNHRRLAQFRIISKHKRKNLMSTTFLNAPTTTETVQALDQYGVAYTGADLKNFVATSSNPANVGASLGAFDPTSGQAVLTLTQAGGEGTANVTIADSTGADTVNLVIAVQSYTPVLGSFTVRPSVTTPTPTPVPPATPAPTASPVATASPSPTAAPAATDPTATAAPSTSDATS